MRKDEQMMSNKYISLIKDGIYELGTGIFANVMRLRPLETGSITDNLFVVRTGSANFFIYRQNKNIICIDSGYGRNIVKRELGKLGMDPGKVTHLFLTHTDYDHTDGLAVFDKAEIYLSSAEEQLITGRKSRKLGLLYNFRIKRSYHLLKDNDVVTAGSIKIKAISTPGHTIGSMSYLVNESILFVGDAFKMIGGRVYPKDRFISMSSEQEKESIRKLARLDHIRLACTAHNGCTGDFSQAIRSWK